LHQSKKINQYVKFSAKVANKLLRYVALVRKIWIAIPAIFVGYIPFILIADTYFYSNSF
tara:strand:- start:187 stop:363 length:177 start_codon:yes stop_codon:yes gene_type:complete